jgi:hypothetical protein
LNGLHPPDFTKLFRVVRAVFFHFGFWIADFGLSARAKIRNPKSKINHL